MMRLSAFLFAVLVANAWMGCGPGGAVETSIQFEGWIPGCVRVTSADAKSGQQADGTFLVDPERGQHSVAIYPKTNWGNSVLVTAEGLETTCSGATVAKAEATAQFPKNGFNQLTLILSAVDADGDGYIATNATLPGTDCDDLDHARNPGAFELCNGMDDDCDGQIDDSCT